MREIKFRAWDKLEKRMDDVVRLDFGSKYPVMVKGISFNFDMCILMQFTGLLDKNGKEIYEGDILEVYRELKVIKWDEVIAGFSWKNCSMDNYLMFRKYVAENCEIRGNIYENPELITT